MKPAFKCDYCDFIGTEEEVKKHEEECFDNYDKKGCTTCRNRGGLTMENEQCKYECKAGKDVPAGNIYINCDLYDRKEKTNKLYDYMKDTIFDKFF